MKKAYCIFDTVLGNCGIAWRMDEGGAPRVTHFQLPEADAKATAARIAKSAGGRKSDPPPPVARLIKQVCKHLAGDPQDFRAAPFCLDGVAPFAHEVYRITRAIPAGQTQSYGDIAKALGQPGAARAVGQALGRNPIPLLIPCHRVLAAGKKPGGFSAHGGLTAKARLLAIEGVSFGPPPVFRSQRDLRQAARKLRELDPRLGPFLDDSAPFRIQPAMLPYASLFEAIVHQQLSMKAAATILGRVLALFPGEGYPAPADLLATDDEKLRGAGLSAAKVRSLRDLSARTLDGTVPSAEAIVNMADGEIIKRLSAICGVGQWTAEMLLIFALGRCDVLPVDDFGLRKAVMNVYGLPEMPTPETVRALGEAWRPYRTAATLYLWHSLAPKQLALEV